MSDARFSEDDLDVIRIALNICIDKEQSITARLRIGRTLRKLEEVAAASQPATFKSGDRVSHYREGSGTVYQDQAFPNTLVHVRFDSRRGVAQCVQPQDLRRI